MNGVLIPQQHHILVDRVADKGFSDTAFALPTTIEFGVTNQVGATFGQKHTAQQRKGAALCAPDISVSVQTQ